MKKKGFTLVELLGVIIILSILALVTFPPILNQIKKSKNSINSATQEVIETGTYLYMEENRNTYGYYTNDIYCIKLQTLVNAGFLKAPIKNSSNDNIDLNTYVKVNIKSDNKFNYTLIDVCSEINTNPTIPDEPDIVPSEDKIGPVILYDDGSGNPKNLADVPTLILAPGDTFDVQEGITIVDNIDGSISFDKLKIIGSVTTTIQGSYTVKYIVSDSNGNTTTVDRKIAVVTETTEYAYTGEYQTFIVPVNGMYKIELWGAQGGSYYAQGAYTKGEIYLTANDKLYIYVGQKGRVGTATSWNGGAGGGNATGNSGGGATDVRTTAGSTITDWRNEASLLSRIMVAAGGGGDDDGASSSNDGRGGYAGGLYGYSGTGGATAGTQTYGGGFGYGTTRSTSDEGGGGGGYYGGVGGLGVGNNGGSGGSSYISGHTGCISINESSIHFGSPYHYSGHYFINTTMVDGMGYNWTTYKGTITNMPTHDSQSMMSGNSGDGYAKITFLTAISKTNTEILNDINENDNILTYTYSGKYEIFNVNKNGKYLVELWGAQGGSYYAYGGYTSGEISLEKGQTLYVYVGQNGMAGTATSWNGGGGGGNSTGNSGGGATDIRLVTGGTSADWINTSSLLSRIMVAAGGGGDDDNASSSNDGRGGYGGGLNGYSGTGGAAAGTQTSGGAFGYGTRRSTSDDGGGGGGWFGGYGAVTNGNYGGSGGSSYISGHDGCIAINNAGQSVASTYTGIENSYSFTNFIFSNTKIIDGAGYLWTTSKQSLTYMPNKYGTSTIIGNSGDGFARITYIGE